MASAAVKSMIRGRFATGWRRDDHMSQSSLCIRPLIIEGLSLLPEETTDPKHEPRRGPAKGGAVSAISPRLSAAHYTRH